MVAVSEISWEEVADPAFGNPARTAWREAVQHVAIKAHAKLPESSGRIERAVKLVLAGDVEVLPDGTARVASQSNGTTAYQVVNGHCECRDFEKAPHSFCKHRLGAAIARRAQELLQGQDNGQVDAAPTLETPAAAVPLALPEAPASVNCHVTIGGRQVQITLRDTDETRLLSRLTALLAQYPVAQEAASEGETREGWYQVHQVQMRRNEKAGRSWYSHKREDGSWCKGK